MISITELHDDATWSDVTRSSLNGVSGQSRREMSDQLTLHAVFDAADYLDAASIAVVRTCAYKSRATATTRPASA